jgi:protein SCO1/2
MSQKRIYYSIFFGGLVVAFFVILKFVIPGFTNTKLPPIGYVQPFSFDNQDGKKVTEKLINGKVAAVEYFFTTCTGICPRLNKNMKVVYDQFRNEQDFMILSHTCDPDVDSVARLKRFADSMNVDTNKWQFLTGNKDSLYYMARHSYKIDDPADNRKTAEDDFLHTQFVALVDKKGDVVKVYDGLKQSEMKEMATEIQKLLKGN